MVWTSQFPSKSWPSIATSPAELFGNWEQCSVFFHGFPLLWRKAFRLARKGRSSWLSIPPSLLLSCFGSLQWIVRRKSHYLLLTKKLFHNTESFERVSLCLCLQSRMKYVALHNLTRWQFASMYFFYFHCWILCTLCYKELGIEISVREIRLSIENMGGKRIDVMCSWGLCNLPLQSCWIYRGSMPYS